MKNILKIARKLWTASIRRQLMLGIILVHAVLMSIFVFDLVERQRNFLHKQSIQQAKSLSDTLAVNSISWVLANDIVGLEEVIQAQTKYPGLQSAMVLDPNGRILAHSDINKVGLYLKDKVSAKLFTSEKSQVVLVSNYNYIDVASPITSNSSFIGWARVNLNQDENSQNLQVISRNGLAYTFLAIVIGALFAYFMAKGLTRGLQQIVDVAEGIKYGNSKLRTKLARHDELGTLGESFNLMLDTIDKTKRDLQAIMDNSPTIIYVKDESGAYTFVNKRFKKVFRLSDEMIIGKTLFDVFPKAIAEEMKKNDKFVLESGIAREAEEQAPQKDGMHTYSSIKFPLYDDNESIYAVCGISTDITERIEIEKEKSSLESQLLHSQKIQAIGQLTGGIAHDFNNLLAVILGYAELCQTLYGESNEKLKGFLGEIEIAGSRGRDLVRQMMIYSRKDESHDDLKSLQVEPILEETVSMIKATFPSGIKIQTDVEENLPYVNAGESLLSQIFMNLCINAKDAMNNEGALLISVKLEKFKHRLCHSCLELFSGDYVTISIKDNGHGIDEKHLVRIFEPFYTLKKLGEGTGMGLSVVHGVVHMLSGHIGVESEVGKGTTFKVVLPIASEKVLLKKEKEELDLKHDFSALKIMIIDDEPAVLSVLEENLLICNAKVVPFSNSEKALDYSKENQQDVDLIITDQTMPSLSGIELSEKLLAISPDAKIILCTGHSTDVSENSAIELGIKAFMLKPVKMKALYKKIEELV